MRGRISLKRKEGVGSRFQFTAELKAGGIPNNKGPWRILLAEDNIGNQKLASGILEQRGHEVQIVKDGVEAVDLAKREGFDVVLMDVRMPRMNGLEATRAIRHNEQTSGTHLPIIGLTTKEIKSDRKQFLAAGMDGYVPKPIEPELLVDAISSAVNASPRPIGIDSPASAESSQDEPDWPRLLNRIGGDPKLLQTIIELFHEDYPLSILAISDAIEQEDLQTFRLAAHKLKGALSTLDLGVASELAFQLEDAGSFDIARTILPSLESEISRYVDLQKKYLES